MRVLLDADILCYEIGSAKDEGGDPLAWPLVKARIDARIDGILRDTNAGSWQGFLTGSGNFRDTVATIRSYKGHRDRGSRPFWYQAVYNYLRDERECLIINGMEADDAIAIESDPTYHSEKATTVACSKDKDLLQVPGWHYQWPSWKQEDQAPFWVSEKGGWKVFFKQCLIGDSADNILGLYGVGPKSSSVLSLNELDDHNDMYAVIRREYEKRFGNYWHQFLLENGTLLWLLRFEGDSWKDRLWLLEKEYQERSQKIEDNSSPMKLNGVEQTIIHLE